MQLNEQHKEHLLGLLANPALATADDIPFIADLVQAYPYFQALHLLQYEAAKKTEHASAYLAKASLHNGGDLCFRLMYAPETLISTYQEKVEGVAVQEEVDVAEEEVEVAGPVEVVALVDEIELAEEEEVELAEEEEVFDEIEDVAPPAPEASELIFEEIEDVSNVTPVMVPVNQEFNSVHEEAVSIDTDDNTSIPTEEAASIPTNEDHRVSKYDDDQLPYTFLWWLAKTRKEHEQIFQPYVTQKKTEKSAGGELQHQIVEHIFHLQTPFDLEDELPSLDSPQTGLNKKDEIIANFIKNDPQIKAPKAEQINIENKAKKSAEDQDDLVSETLAAIYIEQMLYHKAIETYEKLSLKFPEKSRYFADLIQSLEKKI